jgi:hypothetical protein
MDYSFKRGFKPDLVRIQKALEEEFPAEIKLEDGKLLLSYGALKSICVSIAGKKLIVTTQSLIGASDAKLWIPTSALEISWKKPQAITPSRGCKWPKKR